MPTNQAYMALVLDAIREGRTREGYDLNGNMVISLMDGDRLVPIAKVQATPPKMMPPREPIAA